MVMLQMLVLTKMLCFNDFRKNKEKQFNLSHESVTVLKKTANYEETRVKLINT